MALTKEELIGSLQNEVRILLHLIGKLDAKSADYRPTPKQRSSIELVRYLTCMGRGLVGATKTGTFDGEAWGKMVAAAEPKNLEQLTADIASLSDFYTKEVGALSEDQLAEKIEMFGNPFSRGSFLVNLVLSGHAAYRTQLFCYLKSCGHDELNTFNLWQGVDGQMQAA
jgi:hypothetical protein